MHWIHSFFDKLTIDRFRAIVGITEFLWLSLFLVVYSVYGRYLWIYGGVTLIAFHLMTLAALPSIFKKLKQFGKQKESYLEEIVDEEAPQELELWEKACVGYYLLGNTAFIIIWLRYIF